MTRDQRYRWLFKPLVFVTCVVPLVWAIAGVLVASGITLPASIPVPALGADPVRRVLGIFGKTALNLLLVTLAITPLRQLSGNTHLLRFRRMLGLFVFFYALLHLAVYLLFQSFSAPEIVRDITRRPYITIGFTAVLLLVPLAATSTDSMMRRLKKRWHALHRLIYPIAILGVWHYWWQIKRDIRQPLLYAFLLALLLGWRVWKHWSGRARPTTANGLT